MEMRGKEGVDKSTSRVAVSRRSCDQCRTRKIRCDRGSPCSNCVSAKLDCTHSTVAPSTLPPKQRILISSQYEEKIDEIAKGINGIHLLLQKSQAPLQSRGPHNAASGYSGNSEPVKHAKEQWPRQSLTDVTRDEHGGQITRFIQSLVLDASASDTSDEDRQTISRLDKFLQMLDGPATGHKSFAQGRKPTVDNDQRMPPVDSALAILRWAKSHHSCGRVFWLSRILPQDRFVDICRNVYFAIDEYNSLEWILANGYLFYVFAEHAVEEGSEESKQHRDLCRQNFCDTLAQLPLLLQPSLESVAALALGAFHAIETSTVLIAWAYISTALNHCQTLGYHRKSSLNHESQPQRAIQEHLFWTVYRFERSLALRINRYSGIRDSDITIQADPFDEYFCKVGRLHGQIYEYLYSAAALSQPTDGQRFHNIGSLAKESRDLINSVYKEIVACQNQSEVSTSPDSNINHTNISACSGRDCKSNFKRMLYLQFDLLCHYTSLTLILRAALPSINNLCNVSDECVAVARSALDVHQQYMDNLRRHSNDSFLVTKYVSWAIVNAPFVPFSILFSRVIQLFDIADLERLERFVATLKIEMESSDSGTHPCQLYDLLCKAARLHISRNVSIGDSGSSVINPSSYALPDFDAMYFEPDATVGSAADVVPNFEYHVPSTLSDWYHENQQVMSLLDGDMMF